MGAAADHCSIGPADVCIKNAMCGGSVCVQCMYTVHSVGKYDVVCEGSVLHFPPKNKLSCEPALIISGDCRPVI